MSRCQIRSSTRHKGSGPQIISSRRFSRSKRRFLTIAWGARVNAAIAHFAKKLSKTILRPDSTPFFPGGQRFVTRNSIAGRYDSGGLDHQYGGSLRRTRAMDRALRHGEALELFEQNGLAVLDVHVDLAVEHEKELVLIHMLMEGKLALEDSKPN